MDNTSDCLLCQREDCNEEIGVESSKGDCWSIGVKTLASTASKSDFTVNVSPEDDLEQLYNQIENKTGLKADQQRLIYRGRLIDGVKGRNVSSAASSPEKTPKSLDVASAIKIKDIAGLTDGHTIHLVERKLQQNDTIDLDGSNPTSATSAGTTAEQQPASNSVDGNDNNASAESTASGAASLLAAILGMGSNDTSSTARDHDDEDDDEADGSNTANGRPRWRPRYSNPRRRQLSYRLTEEDLQLQDPGSLESVRQGLLTMHTLLSTADLPTFSNGTATPQLQQNQHAAMRGSSSPLDTKRRFFRGQWVDVRDTVNQWLEATIVDIVLPTEILPPPMTDRRSVKRNPTTVPANDPAVSASDTDGRRCLLLERCCEQEHDPSLGVELDSSGNLIYFRQRSSNEGVQLLLIHYNGWPHRWDEWIRSDSERIRSFRTRTRHPNNSQRISPTVQSSFAEAPSTNFFHHQITQNQLRDQRDRQALLPEISRVFNFVNELLTDAAIKCNPPSTSATESESNKHLPWIVNSSLSKEDSAINEDSGDEEDDESSIDRGESKDKVKSDHDHLVSPHIDRVSLRRRRQELNGLAAILDRLGRTLVDAAPHVAALSLEQPELEEDTMPELEDSLRSGRDRRNVTEEDRQYPNTLGGFLSLLSRDRRRTSVGSSNAAMPGNDSLSVANSHEQTTVASSSHRDDEEYVDDDMTHDVRVDPDYTDFVGGLVNTTRGEVRAGGSRNTARQTSNGGAGDELAGLLGAYLAAASLGGLVSSVEEDDADNTGASTATNTQGLGRILRERGVGGNGIDIHIHAVVTAPGGNVGLATLGGGNGGLGATLFQATTRNTQRPPSTPSQHVPEPLLPRDNDEDDLGIFSELYSETPDPVDPTSPSSVSEIRSTTEAEPNTAELSSAFDEMFANSSASSLPTPTLFSRNSRRSGFVSSSSNSTASVASNASTNNTTMTASSSGMRTSTAASGNRQSRVGLISRLFLRRASDSNNSNN